ncbi:hypothetical protein AB0C27_25655 [Nonomuraea sp. NPDC048882]
MRGGVEPRPRNERESPMIKTARRYAKYAVSALSTAVFVHIG